MKELAAALCKAQSEIEGASKGKTNPAFRSKYADLASVWDACRDALTANGLSVVQFGYLSDKGPALVTKLMHVSGESIQGEIPLINTKGDMQGLGSALTYARRYGLAAMVGVCPEDDDANAASEKPKAAKVEAPAAPAPAAPAGFAAWNDKLVKAASISADELRKVWEQPDKEFRLFFTANGGDIKKLQAIAAKVAA